MTDGDSVESELAALHSVTQQLRHAETEQEICDVAVNAVPEIFDVSLAGLWLYDAEATELQQTAETDKARKLLGNDVVYRPGNSISWEAFEESELRTYLKDESDEGQYNSESRVSSEIIIPVGEYGVMNIGTPKSEAFDSELIQIAKILAANIESALNKAEREHALRVKNDRLEEFVGIISHDLRNPLTVADGHLELARADNNCDHLSKVADAIDRMDTLIDDLLTLAEQGYVVESRTNLSLSAVAEEAWSNVHAPEAQLKIDAKASIFGEKPRLLQVFENLFRNAIDHAGDDVTIQVGPLETMHTSTRVSAADRLDGFYVSDNGPGIPESKQSAVFDSGHSETSTGLGLAIVKRIVEAHGWEISVENGVTGGARFEITGGTKAVSPFETH